MRFAWLRKNSANHQSVKQAFGHPLAVVRKVYNAAFWVFLLPFFFAGISYSTGFIAFTAIISVRFSANTYTNNFLDLTPAEFERYPLRI